MKRRVRALASAMMAVTAGAAAAEVRLGFSGGLNLASLEIEERPEDEREKRTAPVVGAVLAWRLDAC